MTGSWDNQGIIWDVKTGTILNNLTHENFLPKSFEIELKDNVVYILKTSFSPDGTRIVGNMSNVVVIWDAKTGEIIGRPLKGH